MADAHSAPDPAQAVVQSLIVERAAHVAALLVGIDGDDVPSSSRTAARAIRPPQSLIPAPAGVEELSCDVPVSDAGRPREVPGDAADPRA